ncbi:MAG: PAS domain S-box protein [Bacteroidota bacterium]|nr:MAG: PAS domain S-box protein [Bacteroidota bacterium]
MDSKKALHINQSTAKIFAALKLDIESVLVKSDDEAYNSILSKVAQLEEVCKTIFSESKSADDLQKLLKTIADLENAQINLRAQIDNTLFRIWSVDENYQVLTINKNFAQDFKNAFGVHLKEGVSIIISLPEPLKSIWKERYDRALKGEQFSIIDHFTIRNIPSYLETSFTPICLNKKVIGVSCFSRDITKQKETELQFKSLAELSPNPISIMNGEGFLFVNQAWTELSGYSEEEALKGNMNLLLPPKLAEEFGNGAKEFLAAKKTNIHKTYQFFNKAGGEIWVNVASTCIDFNHQPAILSVSTDVTELVKLQLELNKSKANLLGIIENTRARIWSIDNNLCIVALNSNFRNDFKTAFKVNLEPGTSALEGVPEPLYSTWKERYEKVLRGETIQFIEEFHFEGVPQFVEVALSPIWYTQELMGASCYSRDISEQKNAEIALRHSEQRYKSLIENLPSTAYRCAFDEKFTMEFISDEIEVLTGYPASDFLQNHKRTFSSIIHREDYQKVVSAIEQAIKRKTSYRIEYRIIDKDGIVKWVHERGRGMVNEQGEVLHLDGVINDITARKQAEADLRESEQEYRSIFNSMSDLFVRTDLKGNIIIVSPSVADILGYLPEEIVGTPITELYQQANDRHILVEKLMKNDVVREFETTFISKTGEERVASINAKILKNEQGEAIGLEGIARDITYRKMAQRALEDRTRELDSIFENTPVILILIDTNGNVLNINKAGTKTQGYDKTHFTRLLAGEAVKCINTLRSKTHCGKGEMCSQCLIRKTILKTIETRQNQDQVEGIISIPFHNQLYERSYLISTTYLETESTKRVLISLDDITEMRKAEEEIRQLSAAVNQSTATIVITNKAGDIEYVNPQFEKTTGYKAAEVIGKNPRVLKSNYTAPNAYHDLWETILMGETWQGEFLNVKKNKTEYWENAIISPITNSAGEITHFVAIKEDITERKRIQQELVKSEQELREMNDEKSRYLSILAHDLRGLVGSFHAYSNLLQTHFDEFSEEDLREQITLLTKASGDSLSLLDNLLAWGKSTQGRLILDYEKINLREQTSLVTNLLTELASNKKLQLLNTTPNSLIVNTDANILQTILRNLINNAIKFTPEGGTITVSAEKLTDNSIEVSVSDTGIGMAAEILQKLFKLGEKVVREGTNHEQGTGLGLIICKEMIKRLGGSIQVESTVGKGTRFYFNLPAR